MQKFKLLLLDTKIPWKTCSVINTPTISLLFNTLLKYLTVLLKYLSKYDCRPENKASYLIPRKVEQVQGAK